MIAVNMNKARNIAHELRRAARTAEFAPYDDMIAKQIPGTTAQAEAERVVIRDKYAQMQTQLDAAQSPEELKSILNI